MIYAELTQFHRIIPELAKFFIILLFSAYQKLNFFAFHHSVPGSIQTMDNLESDFDGSAEDLRRLTDLQLDTHCQTYLNNPLVYAEWESRQIRSGAFLAQLAYPSYDPVFNQSNTEDTSSTEGPSVLRFAAPNDEDEEAVSLANPFLFPTLNPLVFDDSDVEDMFTYSSERLPGYGERATTIPDGECDFSEMLSDPRYPRFTEGELADFEELQRNTSLLGTVTYENNLTSDDQMQYSGITITVREISDPDYSSDAESEAPLKRTGGPHLILREAIIVDSDGLDDDSGNEIRSSIQYPTANWEPATACPSSSASQQSQNAFQTPVTPANSSREVSPGTLTRSACRIPTSQQERIPDEIYPRQRLSPIRRPSPLRRELMTSVGLESIPENDVAPAETATPRRLRTSWLQRLAAQKQIYNALARNQHWEDEQDEGAGRFKDEDEIIEDEDEEQGCVIVFDSEWNNSAGSNDRAQLRSWNGKVRRGSICPSPVKEEAEFEDENEAEIVVATDGEWEDSTGSNDRAVLRSWNGKVRRGSRCPSPVKGEIEAEG
jgi:hypothetical protein